MVLRLSLITYLSLFLIGVSGCQEGTTLLGAIVCQGIGRPVGPNPANPLGFRGLDARIPPRIRPGSYASPTPGVRFLDGERIGPHSYWYSWSERNGIVYTCKAGHIDIAHVRKAADWTGFLAAITLECLHNNETEFSFKLREPSLYFVKLTYPADWEGLAKKEQERIARDVSVNLGQYFAYTAATWHEILTWFGYQPKAVQSEFQSAFSWEDVFSNLLGTHIAVLALEDTEHDFSQAVTLALDRQLKELGAQPGQTARRAAEKVWGLWFSRPLFFTVMQRRNFDVGLNDGFVTPWLVPFVPECEGAQAQSLPVPELDFLGQYGFSMKLEIEPREWEKDKVLRIVFGFGAPKRTLSRLGNPFPLDGVPPDVKKRGKRLEPAVDFPRIMDHIQADAIRRYGPDVGLQAGGS